MKEKRNFVLLAMCLVSLGAMAAPPDAAKVNWVQYTDSAEAAFSIDVPVGWQVQGGMYRFGYFDVRWMMDARSLDGKIIMRIDDANVPPYKLPALNTGREGQPYAKPQQFQMMVMRYREGQSYAEVYARHRFSSVCTKMTQRKPDWTPAMPVDWRVGSNVKSTEGNIAYDCESSDGPRMAEVYARTVLYPNPGFWVVDPIISIIAAPNQVASAEAMAQHMIESWHKNPEWEQKQQQITQMGLNQIRAGFQQFMQQMQVYHAARTAEMNQQVAHFEARQNAQAQQVSSWGEMLTGLQTLSDPQTGKTFEVFSGPKSNYYTNGLGVTVNSNISPGSSFHQVNPAQP